MVEVVRLHVHLDEMNDKMINADTLKHFKKSAILMNTGRGDLVHEQELADALNNGMLAAYAGDVLSSEPPAVDNPLLSAKNCLITPHQAWAAKESRQRLLNMSVENLTSFLNGTAMNCVNLEISRFAKSHLRILFSRKERHYLVISHR